jgi:channel protein (hemolysin III family)
MNESFLGLSDPFSSISHLLASVAFLVGGGLITFRGRGNNARIISLCIYTFSLVFLFAMSGVYHLLPYGSEARAVLQRLDYAGIWILIAGTFTPVHTILFRGAWRWAILLFVWTVAVTGLVLQIIFFKDFPQWLGLTFFLSLGWLGALTGVKFNKLFKHPSIRYLLAGGIFYSIGAILDFLKWPHLILGVVGPHEIFHVFVVLGALSHWKFVWDWCLHPVISKVLVTIKMFKDGRFSAHAVGERLMLESDSIETLKNAIVQAVVEKYYPRPKPVIEITYVDTEVL